MKGGRLRLASVAVGGGAETRLPEPVVLTEGEEVAVPG